MLHQVYNTEPSEYASHHVILKFIIIKKCKFWVESQINSRTKKNKNFKGRKIYFVTKKNLTKVIYKNEKLLFF
jgi:hypothetical protein